MFLSSGRDNQTLVLSANLLDLYGQSSKQLLPYIHHVELLISLAIGCMVLIRGSKFLLDWRCLPLFGCFGYAEMTRFLIIEIILYAGHLPCTTLLRSWSSTMCGEP
jgi:hypothetical protein